MGASTRSASRAAALPSKSVPAELSDVDVSVPVMIPPSKPKTARKRKVVDLEADEEAADIPAKPIKRKKEEEKRQKPFRKKAPQSFLEKLERAQTQRMVVIGRSRTGTDDCPTEDIDVVGSTGNIYRVTIDKVPTCTCPDSRKGNECKHKVYALATVLKAPYDLQYQRAFLISELKQIFDAAPPIPNDNVNEEEKDGKRKPIEGECPICYMDFEPECNELVWCKAACGNNMHKTCFEQWAASQRGQTVKCVYCRTPWEVASGDLKNLQGQGTVGEDGYVNVAAQMGMSGERDYSSYHPFWVRRHFGRGYGDYDYDYD